MDNIEKENRTDDINRFRVVLEEIIYNQERYYAHIDSKHPEKKPELLEEHIDRCMKYFHKLYFEKKQNMIFDAFLKELLGLYAEKDQDIFMQMLINTIVFHDAGKINPHFQKMKMKNDKIDTKKSQIECLEGSKHSMLSSAIYIDYFTKVISEKAETKDEEKILRVIMLANAYVISRHHSDLTSFVKFLDEFSSGGAVQAAQYNSGTMAGRLHAIFEEMTDGKFQAIYHGPFGLKPNKINSIHRKNKRNMEYFNEKQNLELSLYTYVRFLYSILISCDYYATSEYINDIEISNFGNMNDILEINQRYENTTRVKRIREYFKNKSVKEERINILRNEMFLEAENNLLATKKDSNIFFLEAPTGGGKSNIGMNCSFKLLDERVRKIIYVYPFNTLVEQNMETLKDIFEGTEILNQVAVLNSITPIKYKNKEMFEDDENAEETNHFYEEALLDRQFWNYPFILTTHVTLFQTMFGIEKGEAVSFSQLANSVIVLDEIQSYRNEIWTEIMMFLEKYSRLLNIKVIIMSATLPHLNQLTNDDTYVVELLKDPMKYFGDKTFGGRVEISYELLESKNKTEEDRLLEHIRNNAGIGVKILVEFIRKSRAESFFRIMKEWECEDYRVLCMTGDDNQIDRAHILSTIKNKDEKRGVILVATQVVEAGVDIDMDIGYKDISKLDSEEQFLGRINRNFLRHGMVYFFDLDKASIIYNRDYRMNESYTLSNDKMKEVLKKKDFSYYYEKILELLKNNRNNCFGTNGIQAFMEEVCTLDFGKVAERMRLISDEHRDVSVFLAREIECADGTCLVGIEIWNKYRELLNDQKMEYAKKQVQLSIVRSKMNYFIYRLKKNSDLVYHDRIGELYCINDAEKYFENGRLNKNLLEKDGALFIDI